MVTPQFVIIGAAIILMVLSFAALFFRLPSRILNKFKKRMAIIMVLVIDWAAFTSIITTYAILNSIQNSWVFVCIVSGFIFTFALGSFSIYLSCRAKESGGVVYYRDR